jgi:hypothetical protein
MEKAYIVVSTEGNKLVPMCVRWSNNFTKINFVAATAQSPSVFMEVELARDTIKLATNSEGEKINFWIAEYNRGQMIAP